MHATEARDSHRFALLKYGIQWVSVNGRMFNVRLLGATGDGSTGIRIFMGGSGMIEGTAVKGNIILASENGILLQGTNVSRALVGDRDPDEFHGRCSFQSRLGHASARCMATYRLRTQFELGRWRTSATSFD